MAPRSGVLAMLITVAISKWIGALFGFAAAAGPIAGPAMVSSAKFSSGTPALSAAPSVRSLSVVALLFGRLFRLLLAKMLNTKPGLFVSALVTRQLGSRTIGVC